MLVANIKKRKPLKHQRRLGLIRKEHFITTTGTKHFQLSFRQHIFKDTHIENCILDELKQDILSKRKVYERKVVFS